MVQPFYICNASVYMCRGGANFSSTKAEASWLGKVLTNVLNDASNQQQKARIENSSTNQNAKSQDRWVKVYTNQYYEVYVDIKSLEHDGEAQNRRVKATLKFVYTPLGSQWLGNNSRGYVKPDVITHSYARFVYYVKSYSIPTSEIPVNYYDVHNNLIVKNIELANIYNLGDGKDCGEYIPDSPQEQIKNKLFHVYGWDY